MSLFFSHQLRSKKLHQFQKTCTSPRRLAMPEGYPMMCYPLRLKPGEEIKSSLLKFAKDNNLNAAFVLTCVGSVTMATLRLANPGTREKTERVKTFNEYYEILSLVGTLREGDGHLHISLGDKDGKVIGGHVMGDLVVYTTAEIVLGNCSGIKFHSEQDNATGWDELVIKPT